MTNKTASVWVVTGKSESGDDYGPTVYETKPTEETLRLLAHGWDGNFDNDDNYEEGPGDYDSWVFLTVSKRKIQ